MMMKKESRDFFDRLYSILNKAIEKVDKKIQRREIAKLGDEDDERELVGTTNNEKILRIAHLHLGVKENPGLANNNQVVEYHMFASKENTVSHPDSVPWCSSFICYVVEKSGLRSTNSMMARSWLDWGFSSIKDPMPGDIVVFWRGRKSAKTGHVGIFLRSNASGDIVCLGGNQSDEVNITTYNRTKLLDIRRCEKPRPFDKGKAAVLEFLSHSMINGKFIGTSKKVV